MRREQAPQPEKAPEPHELFKTHLDKLHISLVNPSSTISDIVSLHTQIGSVGLTPETFKALGRENVIRDLISSTTLCKNYAEARSETEVVTKLNQDVAGYETLNEFLSKGETKQGEVFSATTNDTTSQEAKKTDMQGKKE